MVERIQKLTLELGSWVSLTSRSAGRRSCSATVETAEAETENRLKMAGRMENWRDEEDSLGKIGKL